ncbi:MAG: hypothetical protein JSV66_12060 [Trueperaceae bacterium]|nr:MAG: hypothetical protein JSV66_12060 [Trueperaceae bacterium]
MTWKQAIRLIASAIVLCSINQGCAAGFVTRLEDEPVEGYVLTLLDDIHTGAGSVILFVEVDGAPAPEDTTVTVHIRALGSERFDAARAEPQGEVFYLERKRAMYMAFPAVSEKAEVYELQVFLSGKGGQADIVLEVPASPPNEGE